MIRDLRAGKDAQVAAALGVIAAADADVLLLLDVDWDHGGMGLEALQSALADLGRDYPHAVAAKPNSGVPSGLDLDGDGTDYEARDALGYGWFTGDSGLALLSRLELGPLSDRSGVLWSDRADVAGLMPEAGVPVVPLATTAQWTVPVDLGRERITLVTMAAGTPVFDGPEDRNGLRNRAELLEVADLVEGAAPALVLGRANQDPAGGEGYRDALLRLLEHPALQDPRPADAEGAVATVDWSSTGPMRVDYVLPPRGLRVVGSGLLHDPAAGPSRLVWVDVAVP